jgi:N-formylglutamate amidohydrolase
MNADTLILKRPRRGLDPLPILVSIPHYGTEALPQIGDEDYAEPWFRTFAYGFADTFVGDLYSDLYHHGVTVLATPISRIFVDPGGWYAPTPSGTRRFSRAI